MKVNHRFNMMPFAKSIKLPVLQGENWILFPFRCTDILLQKKIKKLSARGS